MDDVNKMITITDSGGLTYKGAITHDKNFSGTAYGFEFSLNYMPPTGN